MQNNQQTGQIAGAIVLAGFIIAGAILLKGNIPTNGSPREARIEPVSKTVKLNQREFAECLQGGKYRAKVQADFDDGMRAGVNGTPSSFIVKKGVVVDTIGGAQPFERVMQQINNALVSDQVVQTAQIRPVTSDDHIMGDINAEVIIVEYSDLECPFCKVFHGTLQRVIEESQGEVAWVYRHYPIQQLHQKAFHEAEATECAWEQKGNDGFWKYTNRIFEITPSNDGLDESLL